MADRDILVKLTIKDDGTMALNRVAAAADKTEKQLEQAGQAGETAGKKIAAGANLGKTDVERLKESFMKLAGGIGVILLAQQAFAGLTRFIGGSIKESIDAQQVVANLSGALGTLGIKYRDVEGEIQRMAKTMQLSTRFGDEEAMTAFQTLLNITGDYNAAMKLMGATADLAAGKNMDLASAAEIVGKAGAGLTTVLTRQGIAISDNTKKQMENADAMGRAEIVLKLVEGHYGGQAAAQMEGFGAKLAQLNNLWGDMREAVGDAVLALFSSQEAFDAVKGLVLELTGFFSDLSKSAESIKGISTDLTVLADTLTSIVKLVRENKEGFSILFGGVQRAINPVSAVADILGFAKAIGDEGKAATATAGALDVMASSHRGLGVDVAKIQAAMAAAAEKTAKVYQEHLKKAINENISALKGLGKEMEDYQKKQKQWADDLIWEGEALVTASMGWIETIDGRIIDNDQQLKEMLERTNQQLLDAAGIAINQFAADAADGVDIAAANAEASLKRAKDNATTWSDEFKGIIAGTFSEGIATILTGDLDDLKDIFTSAFETLGQVAADVFGNIFTQALNDPTAGFFDSLMTNFSAQIKENPAAFAMGGAGAVYSATQQQNRAAGVVSGAIGGAMIGMNPALLWATGGLSPIIGAILGGALGYFSSGSSETPWMTADVGPEGALVTESGGHAGMDAQRRQAWQDKVNAAYSSMQEQWRTVLEMFSDPELFDLIGADPTLTGIQGNPADLAQILIDTILPDEFQAQFNDAFRHGLESLGVTTEKFNELSAALADMPGQERIALLANYINVIQSLNELMEISGDIRGAATKSPWEAWGEGFEDVMDQVEVFRSGWEDLDLSQQVTQGQKTVDLLSVWYQNAVSYMQSLIAMQDQMQASIDSMRERLTMRGMNDAQQGQYAFAQFQEQLRLLQGATTPEAAQAAFAEAMRYLQMLESNPYLDQLAGAQGYQWGEDWLLELLDQLEGSMNTVMDDFQDAIQSQADALFDELQGMFADLTGASGGVGALDVESAMASSSVRDLGVAATTTADAFAATIDGLESFQGRMEALLARMARSARTTAAVPAM